LFAARIDSAEILADMLDFMPVTFAECSAPGKLIKTNPPSIYTMRRFFPLALDGPYAMVVVA
jgi:hypothetical protein